VPSSHLLVLTGAFFVLQIDFANKHIGGGVLGHGCIQEEIRFVVALSLFLSLSLSARP
jgi:hypothetical protein